MSSCAHSRLVQTQESLGTKNTTKSRQNDLLAHRHSLTQHSRRDSVLKPSEKRHEGERAELRGIEARHVPRSASKKCRFPRWEIKSNVGGSRHIVITDINNYYAGLVSGSFKSLILIKNKLYFRTGQRCYSSTVMPPTPKQP